MVYVVLITVFRKHGMSPEDFHTHYEQVHMPLIRELAGDLIPISHNRLYVQRSGPELKEVMVQPAENGEGIEYDAVAELIFQDKAASDAYWKILYAPSAEGRLDADEEKFMDRSRLRIVEMGQRDLMFKHDYF
ncbi:ethyl tert-butyl ether degradation EthD family protein [Pseudohyphozyma bogoriensis]|nr:ethyl tert-butyl ether degradation EthD family protein [Pseudohyphozyma bogoriensis]